MTHPYLTPRRRRQATWINGRHDGKYGHEPAKPESEDYMRGYRKGLEVREALARTEAKYGKTED